MPLNKRFILQVPKLTDPSNHQPTKASDTYLDPIARLQNSVPSTPASNSDKPPGTLGNVPEQDAENTGTPYGTRAERLEGIGGNTRGNGRNSSFCSRIASGTAGKNGASQAYH